MYAGIITIADDDGCLLFQPPKWRKQVVITFYTDLKMLKQQEIVDNDDNTTGLNYC